MTGGLCHCFNNAYCLRIPRFGGEGEVPLSPDNEYAGSTLSEQSSREIRASLGRHHDRGVSQPYTRRLAG